MTTKTVGVRNDIFNIIKINNNNLEMDLQVTGVTISTNDCLQVIRAIKEAKSYNVHGHAIVNDLCNIDYKKSDFFQALFYENEITCNGNTISLDKVTNIQLYFSFHNNGLDWYDIHIKNSYGIITLCFSPKI